ncbi:hypothetical protein ACHAW5_008410 [Stephanodiscus triporus]|uniref:Uncharacterized protein n=1 Tax=Stephanodiscus triporus TaxID=2934178 RepID=A0ABD3MVA7_9STRA
MTASTRAARAGPTIGRHENDGPRVDDDRPSRVDVRDDRDDEGRRRRTESGRRVAVAPSTEVPHSTSGVAVDDLDEKDENDENDDDDDYRHRGRYVNMDDDTCDGTRDPFLRRHRCCPAVQSLCAGSVLLGFLSHGLFAIASLAYVRLAHVQLSWLRYALVYNDVPDEMINVDDDAAWWAWAAANQGRYSDQSSDFEDVRAAYFDECAAWRIRGASSFAVVGVLDYLRYWDTMNVYMTLAGMAGVASGLSNGGRTAAVAWECVSVHLYLLESYNLIHRDHHHRAPRLDRSRDAGGDGGVGVGDGDGLVDDDDDGGRGRGACGGDDRTRPPRVGFRLQSVVWIGDVLFLAGSVLDVMGSYLDVAGVVGMWVGYANVVACYLWLGCAATKWMAEVYFLHWQWRADDEYGWERSIENNLDRDGSGENEEGEIAIDKGLLPARAGGGDFRFLDSSRGFEEANYYYSVV